MDEHENARMPGACFSGLAELLLPVRCAGCAAPGIGLCGDCRAEFGGVRRVRRPILDGEIAVYALARYRGVTRRVVLAYKDGGRRFLAASLGELLAAALGVLAVESGRSSETTGGCCLVPAPSRNSAARRRGGPHMSRLAGFAAKAAAPAYGPTTRADCLRLTRGVRDSVGLDATQRRRNLAGRVRVDPRRLPEPGSRVVLVDDVLTTGATVSACAAALASVGFPVATVVVLTAAAG